MSKRNTKERIDMGADFGDLMSQARAKAGLSLRELQIATRDRKHKGGISIGLLSMIESQHRPVTYESCLKISTVLSLDVATALLAAYRSRVNYCAKREKEALEAFAQRNKLNANLDIDS
jgi:transcriptional regulator with XRE-family HTH domain